MDRVNSKIYWAYLRTSDDLFGLRGIVLFVKSRKAL